MGMLGFSDNPVGVLKPQTHFPYMNDISAIVTPNYVPRLYY